MQSIDVFSMIKMREKMFELLDKWVEQVVRRMLFKL